MNQLRQKHKFLFGSIIFSLSVAIIFSILSMLIFFDDSTTLFDILGLTLIPLLPVLLIALISFMAVKIFIKHPKATKVITGILITFILLLQSLIYFIIFYLGYIMDEHYYDKPKNYLKALESIHRPICIRHFPQNIPKNAQNIIMKKSNNGWFGSEEILLKFDIDKKYIEDELKKYKYNYIEKAEDTKHAFARSVLSEAKIPNAQEKDFTFYIINDRESETPPENSFPYHYGIITNDNKTTIIYYYMNPD